MRQYYKIFQQSDDNMKALKSNDFNIWNVGIWII